MMKKTIILTALILFCALPSAWAGIDFQFGGGYNGVFLEDGAQPASYPLGFSVFGGVGYKFFPALSVGAEYEFANNWSLDDNHLGETLSLTEHLPKAYIKFKVLNVLALSGLAGVDIQTSRADGDKIKTDTAFTMGIRAALLFGYFQYMTVFNENSTDHRISVGVVLNK